MSVLRRRFHVDNIPVFGKQKSKVFFHFKVGAFNVIKLLRHMPEKAEKNEFETAIA